MTDAASKARRLERTCAVAAVALAALLVAPGILQAEAVNATAWDGSAQALCAQRVASLPGGIYVAGTDHKGPLWTSLYVLAWTLAPGSVAVWYVIGALAVLVAALTAEVVRRLVLALGGAPGVALGVALALFAHLLLGESDYSGLLYSRNVTGLLTALALLLALHAGRAAAAGARREALLAAASGAALGWAVETMPTTALPALVVAAALLVAPGDALPSRAALRARWRPLAAFGACALAPLLLVPAYYALRGELADFWQQWWTYNQLYGAAIPARVAQAWPRAVASGLSRNLAAPQFLLPLLTFVLAAALEARRGRRPGLPVLLVVAWFVAECAGLSASLRFFGHYFVLPLLPAVVLGGVAASWLARPERVRAVAPLALLALTLPFCGRLVPALAKLRPDAPSGREERLARAGPGVTLARAVVDLVSDVDEDVYVWARDCARTALLRRRAPTRYVENRWLTGEVYGWNEPPDARRVLPGTEERWARDVAATPPAAVVEWGPATTIPAGSVVDRWRAERFVTVASTEHARVDVERGRWAWFQASAAAALHAAAPAQVEGTTPIVEGVGGADLVCVALADVSVPPGGRLALGAGGVDVWSLGEPDEEEALEGDVVVLARNGALVVLRDERLVAATPLSPGAERLTLTTSGGGRVARVGLARGLVPPWPASPD
jgi:hypothetical protein